MVGRRLLQLRLHSSTIRRDPLYFLCGWSVSDAQHLTMATEWQMMLLFRSIEDLAVVLNMQLPFQYVL